ASPVTHRTTRWTTTPLPTIPDAKAVTRTSPMRVRSPENPVPDVICPGCVHSRDSSSPIIVSASTRQPTRLLHCLAGRPDGLNPYAIQHEKAFLPFSPG